MRCTICLSKDHVAASCPMRRRWFDIAISIIAVAFLVVLGRSA